MARFKVEERILHGDMSSQIWARLRQYVLSGVSVELVERVFNGERVIEVRRWTDYRDDDSNFKRASQSTDYTC